MSPLWWLAEEKKQTYHPRNIPSPKNIGFLSWQTSWSMDWFNGKPCFFLWSFHGFPILMFPSTNPNDIIFPKISYDLWYSHDLPIFFKLINAFPMILPQCQGAHVGVPVMAQIQRLTALHGEGSAVSGVAKNGPLSQGKREIWNYCYCMLLLLLLWWDFMVNWLVVSTPLKNISQLGVLFPIYGTMKNVPNHQPVKFYGIQPPSMVHLNGI